MEKKRVWVVDDGVTVKVADSEADAYYSVIQAIVEDDPGVFLMLIQDCFSKEEIISLGRYLDQAITVPMVHQYQEV